MTTLTHLPIVHRGNISGLCDNLPTDRFSDRLNDVDCPACKHIIYWDSCGWIGAPMFEIEFSDEKLADGLRNSGFSEYQINGILKKRNQS